MNPSNQIQCGHRSQAGRRNAECRKQGGGYPAIPRAICASCAPGAVTALFSPDISAIANSTFTTCSNSSVYYHTYTFIVFYLSWSIPLQSYPLQNEFNFDFAKQWQYPSTSSHSCQPPYESRMRGCGSIRYLPCLQTEASFHGLHTQRLREECGSWRHLV